MINFALNRRQALVLCAGGVLASRTSAFAALPVPSEKVILSISGQIGEKNREGIAAFDRAMLEKIGWDTIETTSPWYTGAVKFEGPRMRAVLNAVRASGQTLQVQALNDYVTEIPISDFSEFDVILAMKRDGEYMPVRDKGPLFIVYPYDSKPELKAQQYYKRSAWQVARMVVK
jgi:hypothetical protein